MRRIVSVWLPDWPITVWSKTAGRARPEPTEPPSQSASLTAPPRAGEHIEPKSSTAKRGRWPGGPEGAQGGAEGALQRPFALTERTARGLVLSALNAPARALGLKRGQSHADARAIIPDLKSAPAEPDRDRAMLRRLALWAERFSPCVGVDEVQAGAEGLLLDMTGAAHLFGGEAALLQDIEQRLARAAITARAAIADTPGAAWALARFCEDRIAPEGRAREALKDLPTEALRLGDESVGLLRRFGLKRIGDLYALPRAALARRFRGEEGMELVRRLDQALGVEAEPLAPVRPAPLYRAWRAFAEPILDTDGVAYALPGLVEALAAQLERDGQGARRLVLTAFRVDGRTTGIEAGLSAPVAAPKHLLRLLKARGLERLDLGFGADALMISAHKTEAAAARQADLGARGREEGPEALAALIDRLSARLGEDAVVRPALRDSHLPERSEAWIPASPEPPAPAYDPSTDNPRPLFLLDPPEPIEATAELPDSAPVRFAWRRVMRKVVRAEGPERLSPEWWSSPACGGGGPRSGGGGSAERTRDYYRVEDEDGRRYWLFREGLYERPEDGRLPAWWLHGVFA